MRHPIQDFLDTQGFLVVDGGLSTVLEAMGYNLDHPLWTATLIGDNPSALKRAHTAFLNAGADCVISASYQASVPGLMNAGYTHDKAVDLIKTSYVLATNACNEWSWTERGGARLNPPIAAASIGPYGAYLADGSEYRGNYCVGENELLDFHRERFDVLAAMASVLAIETIPSLVEARALATLLREFPHCWAWVSFCCADGAHIADGHRIEDAVATVADIPSVIAVGVNCTAPRHVSELIKRIRDHVDNKEIIVYPNSGETYCTNHKTWKPREGELKIADYSLEWYRLGARLIGGCCRVLPHDVGGVRDALGNLGR